MTPGEFAAKWHGVETGERASAQSHFLDLCRVLDQPGPTDADPTGEWYAFEKGAEKFGGGDGFADVWKRSFFAWEYKGKGRDLRAALRQLVDYKDALENPPLLVVSDLERIEVHTNFTGLSPRTYTVTLDDLAAPDPSEPLRPPPGSMSPSPVSAPRSATSSESSARPCLTARAELSD